MDLVTRLKLDSSEYNSNIDSAKEKTKQFQDTANEAGKSVNDLGDKGSRSAKQLLGEMSKFEGAGRSVSNYRRQLMEMQKQIADLTIAYRGMNDEMKNSALGQEVANKIQELTMQAAQYKDAISDVQQEISRLASDTAGWDGMKQGIDMVSSSVQAFVASGVLGEKSTEKLVAVIAKLKAVEAGTNAVIKIGNALQKNSAIMAAISTIQTKALARAKTLETTATKGATVAQRVFNAVAKANPYVLLASAIIAVGSALAAFAIHSDKAKKAEEEAQKAHEDYMSSIEDMAKSIGNAAYNFDYLKRKYSECKSEGEKQQFMKDYKSKLDDLGISVKDINGLEDVFINKSDDFRRACLLRAQALGLENMAAEKYQEMMTEIFKARDLAAGNNKKRINEGTPLFDMLKEYKVYDIYVSRLGKDYVISTDDVLSDLEKAIRKRFKQTTDEIIDEQKKLENEIGKIDLGKSFNANGKGNSGGNDNGGGKNGDKKVEIIPDKGSFAEAQKKVNELQTKLNNMSVNDKLFEKTKKDLEEAKKELQGIQDLINGPKNEPKKSEIFNSGSLKEAQHFVKVFQDQLNDLDPKSEEFAEVLDLLNAWKNRLGQINGLINGSGEKVKTLADQYKEISSKADDINFDLKIGAIDNGQAQKMVDDLNKKLSDLGLKADLKLEVDEKSIKSVGDQMRDFVDSMDAVSSVSNAIGAINSVYDSISSLGDKLSEAENGWEAFFAVFQMGMNIFNAVTTVIEAVATATDILTAAKAANAAGSTSEAAAAAADATAQGADAAATMTNAAAHGAAAAAQAGQSVSSIPYVGPVLAIAAIVSVMAAIIGIIASAKGFAKGGIVDAPSKIGDKNIIRVNGGEMVLTKRQQANLFKILDEGRRDSGDINLGGSVQFKVQGSDLIGVLNNYQRKNSKL